MALFALIAFSCTTEDENLNIAPQQQYVDLAQDSELYDYLDCQDFDLTDAKLYDEHVVVEGDISIRLDVIRKMIEEGEQNVSNGRTSQFVGNTNSVAAFSSVLNIEYFIHSSVVLMTGDWDEAIEAATQDWEDLPYCRIGFERVYSAVGADLKFYADNESALPDCMEDLGGLNVAQAEFSGEGIPGRWISINVSNIPLTLVNRESIIRHEIGHTLGFRHDDPIGNDEPVNQTDDTVVCDHDVLGANKLVGTPTIDASSIMNPITSRTAEFNLSSDDGKASTYLYPDGYTAPVISSITQYYATSSSKNVKIIMSTPSPVRMYRYRADRLPPWSSTPVQSNEYVGASNTFWLYNVPHGTWKFRITSLNYGRDATYPGNTQQVTIQ